jgi:hypothetical protein
MLIEIAGVTQKGKNRVTEHGSVWEVLDWKHPTNPISFAIKSLSTDDKRWMTNDFKITWKEEK